MYAINLSWKIFFHIFQPILQTHLQRMTNLVENELKVLEACGGIAQVAEHSEQFVGVPSDHVVDSMLR